MGRKRIYGESNTKTSTAQKEAAKAYYNKNKAKYGTISITQSAEQTQADKAALTAHNLTPLQAWRRLMSELNAEPLPTPDNSKENENPAI